MKAAWFACLLLAILPFGSSGPAAGALCALAFSALLLVAVFRQPAAMLQEPMTQALTIATLLVGWVLLQGMLPAGTLSDVPVASLDSAAVILCPFVAFISALLIFRNDKGFLTLWNGLALTGAAVAIIGLLQYTFTPDWLLFHERTAYKGSLTGTFVNRNSAATFLGLSCLLWLGRAAALQPVQIWRRWADGKKIPTGALFLVAAGFTACFIALLLTRSRAGVIASLAGLTLTILVLVIRRTRRTEPLRRLAVLIAVPIVAGLLLLIFGGFTLHRMETLGFEDFRWCVYSASLRAIWDNPLLGYGAGTFKYVFPEYRTAACGPAEWLWDKAHNSWIETWLTLGLVGILAGLRILMVCVSHFRKGLRQRHSCYFAPACGMGALLLVLAHGLFDFSIQINGVAVMLAAMLAASVGLSLGREANQGREQ